MVKTMRKKLISKVLVLTIIMGMLFVLSLSASAAELTVVSMGIYTNGNPVIIDEGASGTLIYYDADADGEIDEGETPMALAGPSGDSTSGYNLSTYDIYGTAPYSSVSSSKITLLSGQVSYIFGSGPGSGVNVTGNTDITVKGGSAVMLYGGGNYGSVGGNTNITVTGGTVYGGIVGGCGAGTVSGSANVTITGGTINANLYGGGYGGPVSGSTNVTITGGTINSSVYGGGYNATVSGTATVTVGVDATITGTVTSGCCIGGTVGTGSQVIYEVAFYDESDGSKYDSSSAYPPQWITSGATATKPATDPSQTEKLFSGWKKVSDDSDYNFGAAVSAAVKLYPGWLSTDATLKAASTVVKGQTVTDIGTPNSTLGSETAGFVTITAAQAADTSNAGSFITLFDKNDTNADVKVVKYAFVASTTNFAGDTAYADEAITNGDFFIVRVTAQDSTTVNFYRINVTVMNAPTVTATGGTPTFLQGNASGVDLFSSVTAATNDSGQTFSDATFTVTNVADTTEYLTIGGTNVALTDSNSGSIAGVGNYSVSMSGSTATVTLSGMALANADMGTLIDGIAYKNTDASVTTSSRVVTLTSVTDNGSGNNSATLSIAATVTVSDTYVVTGNGTTFNVNGSGGYASLALALGQCTGINPKIQMGNSAADPLIVNSVSNSSLNNALIAAIYSGWVKVTNISTQYNGLIIPNSVTATFDGLSVTNDTTAATGFHSVYLTGTGSLNITGSTSITNDNINTGYGVYVYGTGTLNMTGGTISASGSAAVGIYNSSGTVNISGGTINSTGSNAVGIHNLKSLSVSGTANITAAYIGVNLVSAGTISVSGGTIEATGVGGIGMYCTGIGAITMTGGTVMASNATNSSSNMNFGMYVGANNVQISGGTVSCCGPWSTTAAVYICGSTGVLTVSGDANITGAFYGIESVNTKTTDNGGVYINGGTVSGKTAVSNNSSGLITINAGNIVGSSTAVNNNNTGIINITGGTITGTGDYSSSVSCPYGGTVNISGGTFENTSSTGSAISLGASKFSTGISTVNLSGTPVIKSASTKTIDLSSPYPNKSDKINLFGKTVYGDVASVSTTIAGASVDGKYQIDSTNFSGATVTLTVPYYCTFLGWTSDAARTVSIGDLNTSKTITALTTSGNSDIYVYAIPNKLVSGGSFTDSDNDKNQVNGTISWTAASPTSGITGYKIYWGSSATTKLAGYTDPPYSYMIKDDGSDTNSQTVVADTAVPDGAKYFLIYSYNICGNSTGCHAIEIGDIPLDTTPPTVSSVSAPSNDTYVAGENLDFTVTFDEAVNVVTTGGTPYLTLAIGSSTVNAAYLSGTGTTALTFRYTVAVGDMDADGVAVSSGITLNGGTIKDAAGNDATLTFIGSTATSVLVDAVAPAVWAVTGPSAGTYQIGDELYFTATTSENVTISGTPYIALTIGSTTRHAAYVSGGGSTTLKFLYIVAAGDYDADGILSSSPIILNGGTIKDAAGNDATLTFTAPTTTAVLVDGVAPTVWAVTGPSAGTYQIGDELYFTATISEPVNISGTPYIALTIGSTTRHATYVSGSNTTTLKFLYIGAAGDYDADGILSSSPIILNGGTIKDWANNDATLIFTPPTTTAVLVDGVAPTVASVSVPSNGRYAAGENLDFTINFSEAVYVDTTHGTPSIALAIGSTTRNAAYVSGSNSTAIKFRYTVITGDSDTDGITVGALLLNGGTIIDYALNDATLTLNSVGSTAAVLVDTTPPMVSSVGVPANRTYKAGDNLDFTVNFAEDVDVVTTGGTPYITLTIGSSTVNAPYVSGTGTTALTFRYTVATGDSDTDGIGVGSEIALNSGTIKDVAGNDATLTLNNVGSTTAVLVDGIAPTIGTVTLADNNSYIDLTFSEGIYGATDSTTALTAADLTSVFNQNGGDATNVTISSVKKTDDTALAGGEITIRVFIDITGKPSGVETVAIKPADGASVYDAAGNAMAAGQTTDAVTLGDRTSPTVGNGGMITITSRDYRKIGLSWTAATDNVTAQADLLYKVVYSTTENIATVDTAEVNGVIAQDWTANLTSVTVQNLNTSTTYYFNVIVKDASGNKTIYTTVSEKTFNKPEAPTTPPTIETNVLVNGQSQSAGTSETTTNSNGQTVTTVTVDTDELNSILEQEGHDATVTISTIGADVSTGVLTGQMVDNMEENDVTLEIRTDNATYSLPAEQIDINAVSESFGTNVTLADITVNISIAEPSDATATVVSNAADEGGFTLVVPAVDYSVTCSYNGQTADVTSFDSYVVRTIAIPDGVDPAKITTGVVVDPDGTVHHVPTKIIVIDGVYYAQINSLTNSTYTVIYNPVEFADVTSHWAKDAVNDMGSRLVVTGVDGKNYQPDRDITRAEFATIMVRALGLGAGLGDNGFSDVDSSDWYCGYIETAVSYGLITGYSDGSFRPGDKITREQAMTIIARAMEITKLESALTDSEQDQLLAGYTDAWVAADYALTGIAACIDTGVVNGRTATTICPQDNITRAEVAAIVQRLLQKSGLI